MQKIKDAEVFLQKSGLVLGKVKETKLRCLEARRGINDKMCKSFLFVIFLERRVQGYMLLPFTRHHVGCHWHGDNNPGS